MRKNLQVALGLVIPFFIFAARHSISPDCYTKCFQCPIYNRFYNIIVLKSVIIKNYIFIILFEIH